MSVICHLVMLIHCTVASESILRTPVKFICAFVSSTFCVTLGFVDGFGDGLYVLPSGSVGALVGTNHGGGLNLLVGGGVVGGKVSREVGRFVGDGVGGRVGGGVVGGKVGRKVGRFVGDGVGGRVGLMDGGVVGVVVLVVGGLVPPDVQSFSAQLEQQSSAQHESPWSKCACNVFSLRHFGFPLWHT